MSANQQRTIVFTGGGSAGHVTPNVTLIERFLALGWKVHYIGSLDGIEKEIIGPLNIPYHPISTGKLRRYMTWKNLVMPFSVLKGIWQSIRLCQTLKPDVVFSKGGFVSLPVVMGAWVNRIPTFIHEADITPGLANKLSAPFAKYICITNDLAKKYYKNQDKLLVTGIPVRSDLLKGNAQAGKAFCQFERDLPIILVFGGSLGAGSINKIIRNLLPSLLPDFNIAHICGKNKVDASLNQTGYRQFEYIHQEMGNVMACANLVISRAGANSVYELLTLKKPHILIPLPTTASRGDQIDNAKYYADHQLSSVIFEEELSEQKLLDAIKQCVSKQDELIKRMEAFQLPNSAQVIEQNVLAAVK